MVLLGNPCLVLLLTLKFKWCVEGWTFSLCYVLWGAWNLFAFYNKTKCPSCPELPWITGSSVPRAEIPPNQEGGFPLWDRSGVRMLWDLRRRGVWHGGLSFGRKGLSIPKESPKHSFHCTLQSTWPAGLPTLCPSSTGKWQKSVNLLNTGRWRILKDERECSILFHLWHHSHISSGLQCWTKGSHCASLVDTKAHSTGALHIPSDWCWCHGSRNGHGRDGKAPYKENGGNRKERRVSKTERETICLVWNANAIQHAPWLVFWPQTLPGGRGNENVHQVVSGQWGLTGRTPVGLTLRWTADSWGPASAPRKPDSSEVQKVTKWHNPWKEQGWSFSSWSLLEDQQDIGGGENLEQSKHASYL